MLIQNPKWIFMLTINLLPKWIPLRFWPEVVPLIDDVVSNGVIYGKTPVVFHPHKENQWKWYKSIAFCMAIQAICISKIGRQDLWLCHKCAE